MNRDFIDECVEWLGPLGYSVHSCISDHTEVTLWNITNPAENYPFIKCTIDEDSGIKKCCVETMIPRSIFVMNCDNLSFKHKDIERFINQMKYYLDVIEHFQYKP